MSKSISSLLKYTKGNRGSVIPKNILNQIEKVIKSSDNKIQHHEILNLYEHLSMNRDETSFRVIDALVFPARSQQLLLEPSLGLAYRRLYCLAKYQIPYGTWLEKVRKLLHQSRLNPTDYRYLLTLGSFQNLKLDENFVQLYEEILTMFEKQTTKFDLNTLVALRRNLNKCIMNSMRYESARIKVNTEIKDNLNMFFNPQLKFLFHNNDLEEQWIFYYFLKCRDYSFKKYGFLLSFFCKSNSWKEWASQKFNKEQIIGKLPTSNHQYYSFGIVQKIFSHTTTIERPYIDEFFEFIEHKQGDSTKIRLKNPQKDYNLFILNAYYYFDSKVIKKQRKEFERIQQVLENTTYLRRNTTYIFLYVSIRLTIIFYSEAPSSQKIVKQLQIIKEAYQLINQKLNYQFMCAQNYKLLPIKCFRNLGALHLEVYKTPQFKEFMEKFSAISREIYLNVLTTRYPIEFKEIQNVIEEYMKEQKAKQSKLFFGQMKKVKFDNPNIEIFIAKNVEVNRKLCVDYLVKIKAKGGQKEIKMLLDFRKSASSSQSQNINWKSYWKHRYLIEWCKLFYVDEGWVPVEEYFQSEVFKKRLEDLKV